MQLFTLVKNRRRHQINDGGGRRRRGDNQFELLEVRQFLSATSARHPTNTPIAPPPAVYVPEVAGPTLVSNAKKPVKDTPTLAGVTGLKSQVIGTHRIRLDWSAFSGANSYQILRRTSTDPFSVIVPTTAITHFDDSQLTEKTTYDYQIIALNSSGQQIAASSVSATTDAFQLYNSFLKNIDLSGSGITKLLTATVGIDNGKPNLNQARQIARTAAGILMDDNGNALFDSNGNVRISGAPQNLVLDQESGVDAGTTAGRKTLLQIIATVRDEWSKYANHPEFANLKIGLFGQLPVALPSNLDDADAMTAERAQTDQMAPLAQALDFIVAYAYADRTDPSSFGAMMSSLIREAQRFRKPVYSYIWPEYFEQEQAVPTHAQLDGNFWRTILDEARNESDGAIMWGQLNRFNPNDAWATVTENYMKAPRLSAPAAPTNVVLDSTGLHLTWQNADSTARVRIERSVDGGANWRAIGITAPGETRFDDPGALSASSGFSPTYRIQAFNPFASSAYVTTATVAPKRDAFAVNHAFWADAKSNGAASQGPVVTNLWDGSWVEFKNVAFRENADHLEACFTRWARLEVWIDCTVATDGSLQGGTKVGSMVGRSTTGDSPLAWYDQSCPFSIAGGKNVTHNVFIKSGVGSGLLWLDWVKFGRANDPSAAPRALSADSIGGAVRLMWFDASDDETGFRVERSSDRGLTWAALPNVPAHNPKGPTSATSMVSYVDKTAGQGQYLYRVASLHGTGVNRWAISEVATGAKRSNRVPFSADSYDEAVGVFEYVSGELYHTELGASNHQNEASKGAWVKYSGVDFAAGSNRITLDVAPTGVLDSSRSISFYVDRLDPANKIGTFVPTWNGGWPYYDEETAQTIKVTGVHDLYMQFDNPDAGVSVRNMRIDSTSPVPVISTTSVVNANSIKLMWTNSGTDVTGYIVQWRAVLVKGVNYTGDGPNPQDFIGWTDAQTDSTARSYNINNLNSKYQYEFRVVAKTASGLRPSVATRFKTK